MNLSEKLNLDYCDTTCIAEQIQRHLDNYKKHKAEDPNYNPDIWGSPESPFYIMLTIIKTKQDKHEVVTDEEYRGIPTCGLANYWSAAEGYYLINFHYNFGRKDISAKELFKKFVKFLSVIDFVDCQQSETSNWKQEYKWFISSKYQYEYSYRSLPDGRQVPDIPTSDEFYLAKFSELEKFIYHMLDLTDKNKKYNLDSLLDYNRNICPEVFDNVVRYFRAKEDHYSYLEDKYLDKPSLKAKDVMEILDISRRTLSTYVTDGKVLIDTEINGKYKYNKASVFKLLRSHHYIKK